MYCDHAGLELYSIEAGIYTSNYVDLPNMGVNINGYMLYEKLRIIYIK